MNDSDINMIQQPLLTEDGFVNEACINELFTAIRNMPPTYELLANDTEWSEKHIIHYKQVTGAFAHWAVRQLGSNDESKESPPFPPHLEKIIGYLDACLRRQFDKFGWLELSLCDINKMCHDILMDCSLFQEWNTKECLDKYWLSLDALLHNVCLDIRQERRANKIFDIKFNNENNKEQMESELISYIQSW